MTSPQKYVMTPLPVGASIVPGTLRARLEDLRGRGSQLNLKQSIGIVVPLCVELAPMHRAGQQLFLHPSGLQEDEFGFFHTAPELSRQPPMLPRDKACLAPEQRHGHAGDARASVFAIGAMLYELLTSKSVGPGMRRPSELVSDIPIQLEVILAKALVGDPAHRPDDLLALAQALHQFAPPGSVAPPPPADPSRLDFEVDVSLSMLPPVPGLVTAEPMRGAPPKPQDATSELASLKARLESDPRPRYVVSKDGMDHGPFNAVELLQQIASHSFVESDLIKDSLSKDERSIKDWEEFAPFAEHAKLHREIKAEKEAINRVVVQEQRSTRSKALLGLILVGSVLFAAAVWFLTVRGRKSDEIAVQGESASNVEVDGGLSGGKAKGKGGGGRVVGRAGNVPILRGGMSCESAQAAYVEEMNVGGPRGQADITAGQYGAVLNRGSYFSHCGVPSSMNLNICAAVQNGRAVGVTVVSSPRNPRIQSCVSSAVRRLSFPSHPKLDVTRTRF